MPSGQIHRAFHNKFRWWALVVIGTPILLCGMMLIDWWWGLLFYFGYFIGFDVFSLYIDPDSDQLSLTISEGRLMRDLKILGFLIVWWMLPYAYIMKWFGGHRGLAHVHIIGTITRLVWAGWVPFAVWWWFYFPLHTYILPALLGCFLGLCLADSAHIYLDNNYQRKRR